MREFPINRSTVALILIGLACPAYGQNIKLPVLASQTQPPAQAQVQVQVQPQTQVQAPPQAELQQQPPAPAQLPLPAGRDASFLQSGPSSTGSEPDFSGLATAPPELIPPAAAPLAEVTAAVPTAAPVPVAPTVSTVTVAPLPDVSGESIGKPAGDSLSASMWKGTPRVVAETLLSIISPTGSALLNGLAQKLLVTAAAPPEGKTESLGSLTGLRIQKLMAFGAAVDAWDLARKAEVKLVDDSLFHLAVENLLASGNTSFCDQAAEWIKSRPGNDWQKVLILCQVQGKDLKAAQLSLDLLRAQANSDNIFINVADKNIFATGKSLPYQLTPMTPTLLTLLRLTGLPLSSEMFKQPNYALVAGLLRVPAKQDVAQLDLAERAAGRGVVDIQALAAVYRTTVFTADEMVAPLVANESGLRLRALLFRASENEHDAGKRIAYALKFVQSANPAFLNGAGAIVSEMLGKIKPDPTLAASAVDMAKFYMLANDGAAALEWLKLAQANSVNADVLRQLWPQFVLAGMGAQSSYDADFSTWFDGAVKAAEQQTDTHSARGSVAAIMMLLDAAGFSIPDAAWVKVMDPAKNEKRIVFSPLLLERMQAAAGAKRPAETVLLAVALAGNGEIPLPVALAITRSLRLAGLKSEAAMFARHMVALLTKIE